MCDLTTPRRRRAGGFTVVECLLAGMVMAIFGASIAATVAQSATAARRIEQQRLAARWLDEVFTRIDIIGPARLAVEGPFSGELDERFSWSATYDQDVALLDLYHVAVTLTCVDGNQSRTYRGYTRIHDPAGRRTTTVRWDDL